MSPVQRNWFILIVFAILVSVGVWYNYSNNQNSGSNGNFSQAKEAKPTPYAGWKTYTSTEEPSLSFKYPPSWRGEASNSTNEFDPSSDNFNVTSSNGTVVGWSSSVTGLGGACSPGQQITVTDSDALPNTKGLYLVGSKLNDPAIQDYGISDTKPALGPTKDCPYYVLFHSHSDPSRQMMLTAEGKDGATVGSADTPTVKLILESLKY